MAKAAEYYSRAKQLIEVDQDWQASGSMILKALAEERKSENTGLQVMNVIKYQKPKQSWSSTSAVEFSAEHPFATEL